MCRNASCVRDKKSRIRLMCLEYANLHHSTEWLIKCGLDAGMMLSCVIIISMSGYVKQDA